MKKFPVFLKSLLLLGFLFAPPALILQVKFHPLPEPPLKGDIRPLEKEYFSAHGWFEGSYQEKLEAYLNENFGLRSFFVRLNNQIAYTLFGKARANAVVIGKEEVLMEDSYIDAYYGSDFLGTDSLRKRMELLHAVKDSLSARNKTLLLVFAPGKASFYPEAIPDRFHRPRGVTNHLVMTRLADSLGIPYVDCKSWFEQNKNTSPYPLYPRYGIHWSQYAKALAADSIIRTIEHLRGEDLPDFRMGDVSLQPAHGEDYDVADGMNLLFPPGPDTLAYPALNIEPLNGKSALSALVVSDSFFWGIFNMGFGNCFSRLDFWYYNRLIHPHGSMEAFNREDMDLAQDIRDHDVIIILATDAQLPRFGWGFPQEVQALFNPVTP